MNRQQFQQEVQDSRICPENFSRIYRKFNEYQKLAADTLLEFHRVCEKNNVSYQLAYGSLLGAVRDNGQIPWDYDIDVFVPYEEKMHLIDALKRDLSPSFYFYCPEVDKHCRHVFIRLAPEGYRTEALHVDVFYLAGAPEDMENEKSRIDRIKKLADNRYAKLVRFKDERQGWKSYCHKLLDKIRLIGHNPEKEYEEFSALCAQYKMAENPRCFTADTFADWYVFETTDFLQTRLIRTEIGEFRIPVNYQRILTQIYGDYNAIMPLEDRLEEMYDSYRRLERYAKI